jgi:hypothetical protein
MSQRKGEYMKNAKGFLTLPLAVYITIALCFGLATPVAPKSCGTNPDGSPTKTERVVRALEGLPGLVRILYPNTSSSILTTLDNASATFKDLAANPTLDNYQKAQKAWTDFAKPELLALHNDQLSRIVGAVDFLWTQIDVPHGIAAAQDAKVKANFTETAVKKLEALVKEK